MATIRDARKGTGGKRSIALWSDAADALLPTEVVNDPIVQILMQRDRLSLTAILSVTTFCRPSIADRYSL